MVYKALKQTLIWKEGADNTCSHAADEHSSAAFVYHESASYLLHKPHAFYELFTYI